MQLVSGLLTGTNQPRTRRDRCWSKHILSCKTGDGKKSTVVNFFSRLEFQDGSRKKGTQKYHGSGRPHLHCLFWLDGRVSVILSGTLLWSAIGASLRLLLSAGGWASV